HTEIGSVLAQVFRCTKPAGPVVSSGWARTWRPKLATPFASETTVWPSIVAETPATGVPVTSTNRSAVTVARPRKPGAGLVEAPAGEAAPQAATDSPPADTSTARQSARPTRRENLLANGEER